jgi:thiol-disulfide isomerase/thioredoxin
VVIGAGLALLAPLTVAAQACDADAPPANLDFVVQDMHGNDVTLSDYKGQVILLDFWATWCAPCRIEIPGFIELYDQYGPDGFIVIGFDVDDPVPAIQSFAAELEMDYPVLVGADRDDVKDAYGPPVGFPTSFIIDREGKICASHTGFATKETFEAEILELL